MSCALKIHISPLIKHVFYACSEYVSLFFKQYVWDQPYLTIGMFLTMQPWCIQWCNSSCSYCTTQRRLTVRAACCVVWFETRQRGWRVAVGLRLPIDLCISQMPAARSLSIRELLAARFSWGPADANARNRTLFNWKFRVIFPHSSLQDKLWEPLVSTCKPQGHHSHFMEGRQITDMRRHGISQHCVGYTASSAGGLADMANVVHIQY